MDTQQTTTQTRLLFTSEDEQEAVELDDVRPERVLCCVLLCASLFFRVGAVRSALRFCLDQGQKLHSESKPHPDLSAR